MIVPVNRWIQITMSVTSIIKTTKINICVGIVGNVPLFIFEQQVISSMESDQSYRRNIWFLQDSAQIREGEKKQT